MSTRENWYRHSTLYHLYPLSFADSNSDGFGDLRGIINHLDYLGGRPDSLGVGAIWLSPVYDSPMVDWGYDVRDHKAVGSLFGDMSDFEELLNQTHQRGMRLLMDFVPNHTSIEHLWFQSSRRSRRDPKHDWYVWADAKSDGSPPNNWLSRFGGSAWTYDQRVGQYYLHTFLPEQPDLNWRNPAVREAMEDVLRFWLGKGVDGFRTDAVMGLVKDQQLRDDPPNPNFQPGLSVPPDEFLRLHSSGQSELTKVIGSFCEVLALGKKEDDFLISEAYLNVAGMEALYRACDQHPLHAPFNFNLMGLLWDANLFGDFITNYESSLRSQDLPNWVLGNHDRQRIASRLGSERARLLAFLQLTLRGLPVIYYGDELGLANAVVGENQLRDPLELRIPGYGMGRDPQRAPLPWDAGSKGGFTEGVTWLPLPPHHKTQNVAKEQTDPSSMLRMYRDLIALRRRSSVLAQGEFKRLPVDNQDLLLYERGSGTDSLRVVLNFSDNEQPFTIHEVWEPLVGTHPHHQGSLEPYEGRLYARGGRL